MPGKKKKNKIKSEVKLTHKMHSLKPKFGTALGGIPKKNVPMIPLFRRSTIPGKKLGSFQISSIWFRKIPCELQSRWIYFPKQSRQVLFKFQITQFYKIHLLVMTKLLTTF